MDLVSQKEFARRLKISPKAVRQGLARGRIEIFKGTKQIDFEVESKRWFENQDPTKIRTAEPETVSKLKKKLSDTGVLLSPELQAALDSGSLTYRDAKQVREILAAKSEELEYYKLKGLLVERETINAQWREIGQSVKSQLLGFESKLTDKIASIQDADITARRKKISKVISEEVLEILETLSKNA